MGVKRVFEKSDTGAIRGMAPGLLVEHAM